jgi:putative acetyltransferase
MPITITEASSDTDVATMRELFRAYAESLPFSLDFQGFQAELAELPGRFSPPAGCLLIARLASMPVGIVGLKPLALGIAEIKRL